MIRKTNSDMMSTIKRVRQASTYNLLKLSNAWVAQIYYTTNTVDVDHAITEASYAATLKGEFNARNQAKRVVTIANNSMQCVVQRINRWCK
jgi:hypothetical protein